MKNFIHWSYIEHLLPYTCLHEIISKNEFQKEIKHQIIHILQKLKAPSATTRDPPRWSEKIGQKIIHTWNSVWHVIQLHPIFDYNLLQNLSLETIIYKTFCLLTVTKILYSAEKAFREFLVHSRTSPYTILWLTLLIGKETNLLSLEES